MYYDMFAVWFMPVGRLANVRLLSCIVLYSED